MQSDDASSEARVEGPWDAFEVTLDAAPVDASMFPGLPGPAETEFVAMALTFVAKEEKSAEDDMAEEEATVPKDLVLIVDISGSMCPVKEMLHQTIRLAFENLGPRDRLAVVPFTDEAFVAVDLTKKDELTGQFIEENVLPRINPGGGNSIQNGCECAIDVMERAYAADPAAVMARETMFMLLSDGQDNTVRHERLQTLLSESLACRSARLTCLGFTEHHDWQLLNSMTPLGPGGQGLYYTLHDPADIPTALGDSLGAADDAVARNITLRAPPGSNWYFYTDPGKNFAITNPDTDTSHGGGGSFRTARHTATHESVRVLDQVEGEVSEMERAMGLSRTVTIPRLAEKQPHTVVVLVPHMAVGTTEAALSFSGMLQDRSKTVVTALPARDMVCTLPAQMAPVSWLTLAAAANDAETATLAAEKAEEDVRAAEARAAELLMSSTAKDSEVLRDAFKKIDDAKEQAARAAEVANLVDSALVAALDPTLPGVPESLHALTHLARLQAAAMLERISAEGAGATNLVDSLAQLHTAIMALLRATQRLLDSPRVTVDEGILVALERDLGEAISKLVSKKNLQTRDLAYFRSFAQEHLMQQSAAAASNPRTTYCGPKQLSMRLRFLAGVSGKDAVTRRADLGLDEPEPNGYAPDAAALAKREEREHDDACFVSLGGWRDSHLGLGLLVEPRTVRERRRGLLPTIHLVEDYVSAEAYNAGVRANVTYNLDRDTDFLAKQQVAQSSVRSRINGWLPMYVNAAHWDCIKAMAPSAFSLLATQFNDKFKPEHALDVCTRLMTSSIVRFTIDEGRMSERAAQMYTDAWRTLVAMAEQYPAIRKLAEKRLHDFLENPAARTRARTANLGDLFQYLTITDKYSWQDLCRVVVPEQTRRHARFVGHIVTREMETPEAILAEWEARSVHGRVSLFTKLFLETIAHPEGRSLGESLKELDSRWSRLSDDQIKALKSGFARVTGATSNVDKLQLMLTNKIADVAIPPPAAEIVAASAAVEQEEKNKAVAAGAEEDNEEEAQWIAVQTDAASGSSETPARKRQQRAVASQKKLSYTSRQVTSLDALELVLWALENRNNERTIRDGALERLLPANNERPRTAAWLVSHSMWRAAQADPPPELALLPYATAVPRRTEPELDGLGQALALLADSTTIWASSTTHVQECECTRCAAIGARSSRLAAWTARRAAQEGALTPAVVQELERTIFVGRLPASLTEEQLRELIASAGGTVARVKFIPAGEGGARRRPYCFVELSSVEEVARVLAKHAFEPLCPEAASLWRALDTAISAFPGGNRTTEETEAARSRVEEAFVQARLGAPLQLNLARTWLDPTFLPTHAREESSQSSSRPVSWVASAHEENDESKRMQSISRFSSHTAAVHNLVTQGRYATLDSTGSPLSALALLERAETSAVLRIAEEEQSFTLPPGARITAALEPIEIRFGSLAMLLLPGWSLAIRRACDLVARTWPPLSGRPGALIVDNSRVATVAPPPVDLNMGDQDQYHDTDWQYS